MILLLSAVNKLPWEDLKNGGGHREQATQPAAQVSLQSLQYLLSGSLQNDFANLVILASIKTCSRRKTQIMVNCA